MNPNWLVRVYDGDAEIASWRIDNRTEHEAEREAMANIGREYPDADWTLTVADA